MEAQWQIQGWVREPRPVLTGGLTLGAQIQMAEINVEKDKAEGRNVFAGQVPHFQREPGARAQDPKETHMSMGAWMKAFFGDWYPLRTPGPSLSGLRSTESSSGHLSPAQSVKELPGPTPDTPAACLKAFFSIPVHTGWCHCSCHKRKAASVVQVSCSHIAHTGTSMCVRWGEDLAPVIPDASQLPSFCLIMCASALEHATLGFSPP